MMNKQLFLMMGAPGSGKSTWVKRQLTDTDKYISRDEIRYSLLNNQDNYFDKENKVYSTFVETIANGLLDNNYKRIFADATHLNNGSREKLLYSLKNILKDFNWNDITVSVIWLKTTLQTCLERNNNRIGRAHVPEETIKNMWKSQTAPRADEGIDRVYIINEKAKNINIVLLNKTDENNFKF